jgi:hypothetical protein
VENDPVSFGPSSCNLLDTAADQQVPTSSTPALPRALELTVVSLVSGDFFVDPLPAADLYAVGRILHDWTEAKIEALLKRIYAALPEVGGLPIAEKLLQEDRSAPVATHMQSLNMLVCTEGRERTLSEYSARRGFRRNQRAHHGRVSRCSAGGKAVWLE